MGSFDSVTYTLPQWTTGGSSNVTSQPFYLVPAEPVMVVEVEDGPLDWLKKQVSEICQDAVALA